ncbi:MAG: DUF1570 domain-containing protein [Phycisphaerales bacterium]
MRRRTALTTAITLVLCLAGCASTPPSESALTDLGADDRPINVVVSAERWKFDDSPGWVVTTPSFRVYTTGDPNVTTDRLPAFLEFALAHYTTELAPLPRPERKLETYMMQSRHEWERLTRRTMGDKADMYLRIVRGGYAAGGRGVYFNIGPRDSLLIAAHEGWHQYTQATFKRPLPVWLEEGIAVYMEGFRWDPSRPDRPIFLPWSNPERFDALRDAVSKGRLQSLTDLLSSTPQERITKGGDEILTYYAQLWALTHFLREGDAGAHAGDLSRLLQDAASGQIERTMDARLGADRARAALRRRAGPEAMLTYFADPNDPSSLDGLSRRYEAFVYDIVRSGARHAVTAGKSPISAASPN